MHDDYLQHHGIKGQRWGVRRFQNPDGSLTDAGSKRYRNKEARFYQKKLRKLDTELQRATIYGYNASKKASDSAEAWGKNAAKAKQFKSMGNDKKSDKYSKKAEEHKKQYEDNLKRYEVLKKYKDTLISDMDDTINELKSNGYSYKIKKTNANEPFGYGEINKVLAENGARPINSLNMESSWYDNGYSNASTGNKITVRDKARLSEKKQQQWEQKKSKGHMYEAQRETYYYA